MDKIKTGYAISALWFIAALPFSEEVYDNVHDSGIFMRVFAFLLVMSPVWLVFGWRWLTENKPIPKKVWVPISIATIIWALNLYLRMYTNDLAIITFLSLVPFLLLIWNYQRRSEEVSEKFLKQIIPTKEELINGSNELLKIAEELSNEILHGIRPLSEKANLPPILGDFDVTEAFLSAYSIIYLNLRAAKFENSKPIAIFAGFKRHALLNFAYISQPKFPGIELLTGKDLETPTIKEAVKQVFKAREESVDVVIENISRNDPYPFYPIYAELRPLVSKSATHSELNNEFSSLFSVINAKAKRELEFFVKRYK
jgi:hypothetical protein